MKPIVLILLLYGYAAQAGTRSAIPALDRMVSVDVTNEPIGSVLAAIAAQTQVKFAYSPSVIPAQHKVSVHCSHKPIRLVLAILFKDDIAWKQKKDFIILTSKPAVKTREQKHITISGYIYSSAGDQLSTASVISEGTRAAAVTNQYGYFTMNVLPEQLPLDVKIVKENYPDTTIHLTKENTLVDVSLPRTTASNYTDTLLLAKDRNVFGEVFVNSETRSMMRNLKDTLFTRVQFSFIPYISTNKLLSGNTINDVSINALAGYSQGIRIAEVGGLFNIDRGDVQFFQAAGLCNLVKGNTAGAQLAGIANIDGGSGNGFRAAGILNLGHHMNGIQVGGLLNINANFREGLRNYRYLTHDTVTGIQVAGLANMNSGYAYGIRLAGLYNVGYTTNGIQIGGLFNTQIGTFDGIQVAGLFNATRKQSIGIQVAGLFNTQLDTYRGVQVAGLFNATRGVSEGIQVSGLFNVNAAAAKHISIAGLANFNSAETAGAQVASIVNYSRSVKGTQVALLNFSDTCEGIPVGLVNFSVRGYHKIELFGDEVLYTQLAFRTGVLRFHNIFMAGVDMTRRVDALWSLGYGLGSYTRISEKWLIGADLTAQLLIHNEAITQASGKMGTVFLAAERAFTPNCSVAFGPTVKIMSASQSLSDAIVPYTLYATDHADTNNRFQLWIGMRLAVKLL